jgi:hypothetical protein
MLACKSMLAAWPCGTVLQTMAFAEKDQMWLSTVKLNSWDCETCDIRPGESSQNWTVNSLDCPADGIGKWTINIFDIPQFWWFAPYNWRIFQRTIFQLYDTDHVSGPFYGFPSSASLYILSITQTVASERFRRRMILEISQLLTSEDSWVQFVQSLRRLGRHS